MSNDTDATVKFGADGSDLSGQLGGIASAFGAHFKNMEGTLGSFQSKLGGVSSAINLLAGGLIAGALGSAISNTVRGFSEFADEIGKVQIRTGLSADELQKLKFAAEQSDVGFQQLTFGLTRLQRALEEGKKPGTEMRRTLEDVGFSSEKLKGVKIDEAVNIIADKFKGMSDATQRSAEAIKIFGRSGAALVPFFSQGAEGIENLKKKAVELGIVFSDDAIAQGNQLDNELKQLKSQSDALSNSIGLALTPTVTALVKSMQQSSSSAMDWGIVIKGAVGGIAAVFIGFKTTVEIVFATVKLGIEDFLTVVSVAGKIIDLAFTGDWGKIEKAWAEGLASLDKNVETARDSIIKSATASRDALLTLFDTPPPAPKANKGDDDSKQSSALLDEFKKELAEKKAASDAFMGFSKAQEAKFWQSKLSEFRKGSSAYAEVQREMNAAQREATKQAFDEQIKIQYDFLAREKEGGLARVQEASNIARDIGAKYGLLSPQYREAMKKVEEAALAHTKNMIAIDAEIANSHRDHALAMVDFDEALLKIENTREGIKAEAVALQAAAIEERKFTIKREALLKNMALDDLDSLEHQKHLAELLALDDAYTVAVATGSAQIKAARMKDMSDIEQSWASVTSAMGSSLSSSIKGMVAGTLTLSKAFKNMGASILGAMVDIWAQLIAKSIVKEAALTGTTAAGAIARIGIYAWESAAAVFAWWSRLNPLVAAAMAAIAVATVYGFASNIGGGGSGGGGGAAAATGGDTSGGTQQTASSAPQAAAAPIYNIYVQGDLVDHAELARKLRLPTQYLSNIDTV